MNLDFGKFQLPVVLYTFMLVFATVFTIGLGVLYPAIFLFAGGILLILISDVILSFVLFKGNKETQKGKEVKPTNNKIKELLLHIIFYVLAKVKEEIEGMYFIEFDMHVNFLVYHFYFSTFDTVWFELLSNINYILFVFL